MEEQLPFLEEGAWRDLKEMVRRTAERELMGRFHRARVSFKADGSPVTEADRAMQQVMARNLSRRWPEYGFLGEEASCAVQQRALERARGCWILDPLDGTTNFAHGFELFSCSLALLVGKQVVLGIVHDPVRDETFAARRGMGAELNGLPLRIGTAPECLDAALALVDYKRLPRGLAAALATEPPFASQRNLGSVALDWSWLAAGRADLYLHGGQKLWDYAAGHLIFSEAGGASCTFDREPVPLPAMESRSAVAAASARLLERWMANLAPFLGAAG